MVQSGGKFSLAKPLTDVDWAAKVHCHSALDRLIYMLDCLIKSSLSFREGFRESRRCSKDTYPESYITECILIYEDKNFEVVPFF